MKHMTTEPCLSDLSNVTLVREQRSRVRDLKGYRKSHKVPTEVNDYANSFVARIAADDIGQDLESRFADFRKLLKFKRIELQVTNPEDGVGLIKTPLFDYQVTAALAPDDVAEVLWRREVTAFRKPKELFSSAFSSVFNNLFDMVELIPPSAIDLAEFIDRMEDRGSKSMTLEYDRNTTWCHINLKGIAGQMRLTPHRVSLVVPEPQSPTRLLEAFLKVRSHFSGIDCF